MIHASVTFLHNPCKFCSHLLKHFQNLFCVIKSRFCLLAKESDCEGKFCLDSLVGFNWYVKADLTNLKSIYRKKVNLTRRSLLICFTVYIANTEHHYSNITPIGKDITQYTTL